MSSPGFAAIARAVRLAASALAMGTVLVACSSSGPSSSGEDPETSGWYGGSNDGVGGSGGSGQDMPAAGVGGGSTSGSGGGSSSNGSSGAVGSSGTGGDPPPPVLTCNPIVAGTSSLQLDSATRFFDVQLPANTSGPVAVLFLFHGWMQAPGDFASTVVYDPPSGQWRAFDPNAFPMPLVIVTPWDTKLIPPWGLDWDIVGGDVDFPYFEGMLECLKQQFAVDNSRIYSFGFSAGAVFTNLLSAKYPHLFAATISESGAWFNDTPEQSEVLVPIIQWKWPDFDPADRGNVLLTHGGPNDFATIISLENSAQKALPFLYQKGRTVLECTHTFGHTLEPDLTQGMYYQYLWAHQLGGPPIDGIPPGFPAAWNPVGASYCTFHPAP